MRTSSFQEKILAALKGFLKNGHKTLSLLSQVARDTLGLSSEYPQDIPEKALYQFIEIHPESKESLKEYLLMKAQEEEALHIEAARKKIQQSTKKI